MSKCVLIVDDEADVREITQLGLEMATHWRILTACSGQAALLMAAEHQPDIILLDMMMPGMDGRDTLQQLKANAQTRSLPVILVTAKAQPSTMESFGDLDVVSILAKPFRPLKLAGEISRIMDWD